MRIEEAVTTEDLVLEAPSHLLSVPNDLWLQEQITRRVQSGRAWDTLCAVALRVYLEMPEPEEVSERVQALLRGEQNEPCDHAWAWWQTLSAEVRQALAEQGMARVEILYENLRNVIAEGEPLDWGYLHGILQDRDELESVLYLCAVDPMFEVPLKPVVAALDRLGEKIRDLDFSLFGEHLRRSLSGRPFGWWLGYSEVGPSREEKAEEAH
jgi:hypothetical protein